MVHTSKLAFAALLIALGSHAARADPAADFPSRPIRFIAPIPPGGSTDLLTRDIARRLQVRAVPSVVKHTVRVVIARRVTSPTGARKL